MEIKKYMELEKCQQAEYCEQQKSSYLISDLSDLIWQMTKKDVVSYTIESDKTGLTTMLYEIQNRLEKAEYVNMAERLLKMGFDTDKNTAQDFIDAIDELKESEQA